MNELKISVFKSYLPIFLFLDLFVIKIKNRKIEINPHFLEEYLKTLKKETIFIKKYGVTKFYGKYHQMFVTEITENGQLLGFGMTNSNFIQIDNSLLGSKNLSKEDLSQKYLISKINTEKFDFQEGFLKPFFLNKNLNNYENWVGLWIRLNIIINLEKTEVAVHQQIEKVIKLLEKFENYFKIYLQREPVNYLEIEKKIFL